MKKRILSLILASVMCLSITACGKPADSEPVNENTEESTEDSLHYNITALLSEDNTYNQNLLAGFKDCLTDYLGAENVTITTSIPSEDKTIDALSAKAVKSSTDMIFTAGKPALESATDSTETIPIVATGIMDFKGTLRIASLNGKSWDKTTGKNVTGISSKPSIVDQVSLMIEATDDLQTVGILFSPEDTDAIYQNEIFEAYLDQAGIPWKEYLIPATDTSLEKSDEAQQNSTALTPSKIVAYSAKEGMDNNVLPLGEDTILGLNSTSSTRVALVSNFWTNGKVVAKKAEEETEEDSEDGKKDKSSEKKTDKKTEDSEKDKSADSDESKEDLNDIEAEATIEERITEACNECSAIYVPFGSMLTDQMDVIGKIAEDSDVVVVAGDTTIGENALVTLYYDPYALGYAAGKKAVRVFNGDDITTMKIGGGDAEDSVKLYNGNIAETFGKEFPKSFKEYNEFLETYVPGSSTTRYEKPSEEE